MNRLTEKRSAFPREMTREDDLWSLDEDICRRMFMSAMTYSQEEYVNWNGYNRRSMDDCGFDYYAELDENGYWPALVVDQGETLVLAKDWREAGQHEIAHGSECVIAVKLQEEL